jgi:hypothetical protein
MILTPGGPFAQLANFSFFLVAVFGDLLLIRFFLSLSYIFLLVYGATGFPSWPQVSSTGNIALDTIIWACLAGSLHIYALTRLLLDERPVRFHSEDEEQIWRFFFRRGGMGPLEGQQVIALGQFRRVKGGETIMTPSEAVSTLYLLIEGRAVFSCGTESQVRQGLLLSGHVFDIWLLSLFGIYLGFEKPPGLSGFAAVAETDCLLFYWELDVLNKMAVEMSPAVSGAWRNFALCQLGLDMSWRRFASSIASSNQNSNNNNNGAGIIRDETASTTTIPPSVCSTGEKEGPGHILGGRSRDFTDPLRKYEQPPHILSIKYFLKWIRHSISPFMPRGIRHTNQPISGILGRNRIAAYKTAQAQVVYIRRQEKGLATPPEYMRDHGPITTTNNHNNDNVAITLPSSASRRYALRQATGLLTAEFSRKELEEVSVSDLMNDSEYVSGAGERSVHGGLGGGGGGPAIIRP